MDVTGSGRGGLTLLVVREGCSGDAWVATTPRPFTWVLEVWLSERCSR